MMSRFRLHPQAIGCHACDRMSWDNGSWNKWTDPDGFSYHVCHVCFKSPRHHWRERFLLYEKAAVGNVYLPQGYPITAMDLWYLRGSLDRHLRRQVQTGSIEHNYQKKDQVYEYSCLNHNQIRILSVLPGEGKDEIHCTMSHVDLEAAETSEYEALSYRWEETAKEGYTIWINSCSFVVSHTLSLGMTAFCDPRLPRKLWIDAISIRQVNEDKDDNER